MPSQKLIATVTTSGAVASTNTAEVAIPRPSQAMILVCDLTAAGTDSIDTLDVKVQTNIGGLWVDVAYFTQMLGNGGTKRFAAKLMSQTAFALGDIAAALTAGNVRHLIGDGWRVNYVTVDADADSSFTFSVYAVPLG